MDNSYKDRICADDRCVKSGEMSQMIRCSAF